MCTVDLDINILFTPLPSHFARTKMIQTYEFALEHVGIDFHSAQVWLDYLDFLKSE